MAVTDYSTGCGSVALSFIQMLASCIRGYHDLPGILRYRINGIGDGDECTELSDFLHCNTNHIDPERQLVENTFALDDCGLLAWKVFIDDTNWTDYSNCGEIPQTLIQMFARCIVNYEDHNRLNIISDTDDCAHLTPLLDCTINAIESERLLVTNLFAVDECGRLLLKIFIDSSTSTDYKTECTNAPESFYELLARCIVKYNGHYYLNCVQTSDDCDTLHPFWTCSNNHIDPERALVENIFAVDSCGNLALKSFGNNSYSWNGRGGDQ